MSGQKLPWIIAGGAALGLVGVLIATRPRTAGAHPEPRVGVTAERVLPAAAVPRTPGAREAYAAAQAAPGALDGLYCYCDCSKHSGHRSLLTCFESDHGAFCDICMGEAMLAERLAREGRSLTEIRDKIDRQFGS